MILVEKEVIIEKIVTKEVKDTQLIEELEKLKKDLTEKEITINKLRDELRKEHLIQLGTSDNMDNALLYSNVFSSLEKVGDHIINVSEHVADKNID